MCIRIFIFKNKMRKNAKFLAKKMFPHFAWIPNHNVNSIFHSKIIILIHLFLFYMESRFLICMYLRWIRDHDEIFSFWNIFSSVIFENILLYNKN